MIEFSANNFMSTLISIITESPTSILFIILGTIFTVAMIINVKKNKTIGKSLFIIGWIFIILFIIIKYNGYISKLFDNLINNIFMQIFFPNLATYIITIIATNIIFLYTILNKNTKTPAKIVNSIFFSSIMVLMVYTLDVIIENKINIYVQRELYTNEQVLTLIESTTIIFSIWILIIFSKYLIKKLVKKSNDKIQQEYENEEKSKIQSTMQIEPEPIEPVQIPQIEPEPIEPVQIPQIEPEPIEPVQIPQIEPEPIEPIQIPQIEPEPIEPVQIIQPETLESSQEPLNIEPTNKINNTENKTDEEDIEILTL